MSYLLESPDEATRLESQAMQSNYEIARELSEVRVARHDDVLDAGCGTGLVAAHLHDKYGAGTYSLVDLSSDRLQIARDKMARRGALDAWHQGDLQDELPFERAHFDLVVSRYVFQFLKRPMLALHEFKRTLKPGGRTHIVDVDGFFFNMQTQDAKFQAQLEKLEREVELDLSVGKKLPAMLLASGFVEVGWRVSVHRFEAEEVAEETINLWARFRQLEPVMANVLGTDQLDEFCEKYITYLADPATCYFYNKVVAWGTA